MLVHPQSIFIRRILEAIYGCKRLLNMYSSQTISPSASERSSGASMRTFCFEFSFCRSRATKEWEEERYPESRFYFFEILDSFSFAAFCVSECVSEQYRGTQTKRWNRERNNAERTKITMEMENCCLATTQHPSA